MPKLTDERRQENERVSAELVAQIATAMAEQGVNQTALSRAAKVDRTSLNKMLAGKIPVPLRAYIRICGVLGIKTPVVQSVLSPPSSESGNGLEGFLAAQADDITARERRFLQGVRFVGDDKPPASAEFWSDLLAIYRRHHR